MANIDPVRLLKANPAENLSNLNAVDLAESQSDQSVTSFPKELQAAKQTSREDDASLDKKDQNSLDAQASLQNLPTNASVAPKEPANIADKSKNAQQSPNGLTPDGPTLTQLEVAQAISLEDGAVAQLAPALASITTQGVEISADTQSDAEKQSIDALIATVDPTAAQAIAAAQNPITVALQNIVIPSVVETAAKGVDAVAAAIPQVMATQTPVVNSNTLSDGTQAASVMQTAAQDSLAALTSQSNTDVLTKASADALNAMNVAKSDGATIAQLATDTNALQGSKNQNEAVNVLAATATLNTPEAVTLTSASTATAEIANVAAINAPISANAAEVASTQGETSSAQGTNLVSSNQNKMNLQPAVTAAIATISQVESAADLVKANASDAQDLAKVAQTQIPSSNSLRVSSRSVSASDAGEAVQNTRADSAKIAGVNAEKSAVLDELSIKDKPKTELKDGMQATSSNSSGGLADLNSKTITSPFNQELRLAQSSQTLKLEPQQASLATGPLHVEVMRVLKEGGGRVIMEVTPPDQGAIQLDLRLDGSGRAYLIVEGASDSTKARLEQGGSQLKEQLAQMGLSLSLDMRDRSDQSGHIPFALSNNFSNVANGGGAQVDVALGELMSVSRPGITPDGRVSIYA
jgi:hypothetical protein